MIHVVQVLCAMSNADDALEMSVVRDVMCGVCEMYLCLARGGLGVMGVRATRHTLVLLRKKQMSHPSFII